MKIGLQLPNFTWPEGPARIAPRLADIARAAEEAGFYSHPPILVAGGGEKKTLRLVAQYADACNLYGDVDTIRAKLEILKRHCETLGRDFRTIEVTTLGTVDPQPGKMSSKQVIAHCKALAAIGVHHAVFNMPTVH